MLALALASRLTAVGAPTVAASDQASCTGLSAAGAFPDAVFTIKAKAPMVFGMSFGEFASSFS